MLNLDEIPKAQNEGRIINYNCISCDKPRIMKVVNGTIFDPTKDICPECEMGISDEH